MHTVSLKVNPTGLFDNQKLVPYQSDTVVIEIIAQGYQLLFNEITMARSLEIDLNKTLLKQAKHSDLLYITGHSLMARIVSQFPASTELLSIKPDTLFFRIEEISTIYVPLVADVVIDFKSDFNLLDSLTMKPDSVRIRGDINILETINEVKTRKLELKQVDRSFNYKINLINPYPGKIEISPKEISVSGKVTRFMEKAWTLPVVFTDSLNQFGSPTISQVEFRCQIPVDMSASVNQSMIKIIADRYETVGDFSYAVLKAQAPPFLKNIIIKPDTILLQDSVK